MTPDHDNAREYARGRVRWIPITETAWANGKWSAAEEETIARAYLDKCASPAHGCCDGLWTHSLDCANSTDPWAELENVETERDEARAEVERLRGLEARPGHAIAKQIVARTEAERERDEVRAVLVALRRRARYFLADEDTIAEVKGVWLLIDTEARVVLGDGCTHAIMATMSVTSFQCSFCGKYREPDQEVLTPAAAQTPAAQPPEPGPTQSKPDRG